MLPDRISNPGPLTYESGALPIALRGPAKYDNILGKLEFERSRAKVMVAFLLLENGKEMCP